MNKTFLIGRITKDIELKATTSGKEVCSFTLAVNRNYKNVNGEYETDFINCVTYGKTAELINRYTKKGDRLAVEGRIQTRNYEKDGKKVYITEIIVENVSFLEPKEKGREVSVDDLMKQVSVSTEEIDNIPDNMDLPF